MTLTELKLQVTKLKKQQGIFERIIGKQDIERNSLVVKNNTLTEHYELNQERLILLEEKLNSKWNKNKFGYGIIVGLVIAIITILITIR